MAFRWRTDRMVFRWRTDRMAFCWLTDRMEFRWRTDSGPRLHDGWEDLANLSSYPISLQKLWLRGYKTFSMLNSAEHEIHPAYKC